MTRRTPVLGYGPAASNNGNLRSQTIASAGLPSAVTQNYTSYDGLNRVKMAQETDGWLQTYVYDALENRALVSGTGYYIPGGTWTPQVTADNASLVPPLFPNNRWTGAVHDEAGNQTALPGFTFTYDGENRQVTSTINSVTATYSYDGDGRRVKKVQGSATTVYVYDASGNLAAEYATQPETPLCTTCYLTADHLGSTRLMTDGATGLPKALHDYLPFGEEIPAGDWGRGPLYGSNQPNQKFTGKERDAETGLDYFGARYFSADVGRFVTPDPMMASAYVQNPQTWNRYTYTLNNPLRFVDPDGLDVPKECVNDPDCTIVVKVNVIYDQTMNRGAGPTEQQRKKFEQEQRKKAENEYGSSNIQLDVTYTAGRYDVGPGGEPILTGLRSDHLNLVVSSGTPAGTPGVAYLDRSGTPVVIIDINDAHEHNVFPLGTNTTIHELAHHFLGHTDRKPGDWEQWFQEPNVDTRVLLQGLGVRQQQFREGLKNKRYAVPLNPALNKPKK